MRILSYESLLTSPLCCLVSRSLNRILYNTVFSKVSLLEHSILRVHFSNVWFRSTISAPCNLNTNIYLQLLDSYIDPLTFILIFLNLYNCLCYSPIIWVHINELVFSQYKTRRSPYYSGIICVRLNRFIFV